MSLISGMGCASRATSAFIGRTGQVGKGKYGICAIEDAGSKCQSPAASGRKAAAVSMISAVCTAVG